MVSTVSTTDPPRFQLRRVTADPIPHPLLAPSPRPRERPPPGLHSGMGLLSMGRSWPGPEAVQRLHRTGGAPRSRRSHGLRSLQPRGSLVARLWAAIGAGGKPFGLSKLTFPRGRCRCEGATSYSLRDVYPARPAPTPSPSTTPHLPLAAPRMPDAGEGRV